MPDELISSWRLLTQSPLRLQAKQLVEDQPYALIMGQPLLDRFTPVGAIRFNDLSAVRADNRHPHLPLNVSRGKLDVQKRTAKKRGWETATLELGELGLGLFMDPWIFRVCVELSSLAKLKLPPRSSPLHWRT